MDDLISRSALLEDLGSSVVVSARANGKSIAELKGIRKVLERIEAAPAVDAMEVVRCKECKNYGWEQIPCHGRIEQFCKLHKGLVIVTRDSYCSYGERKENETD